MVKRGSLLKRHKKRENPELEENDLIIFSESIKRRICGAEGCG